jgi:hypothetical protein
MKRARKAVISSMVMVTAAIRTGLPLKKDQEGKHG